MRATRYILGIIAGGIILVMLFYPLDVILPEAYWPLLPDILVHYPIMWILNQLTPAILFFSLFVIGVLLIRGAWKS